MPSPLSFTYDEEKRLSWLAKKALKANGNKQLINGRVSVRWKNDHRDMLLITYDGTEIFSDHPWHGTHINPYALMVIRLTLRWLEEITVLERLADV